MSAFSFVGFTPSYPGAASTPNAETAAHLPSKGNGTINYSSKYDSSLDDKLSDVRRLPNPEKNPLNTRFFYNPLP